jgi:hypothetical protein
LEFSRALNVESTTERRATYRICVHGVVVKLHEEVGIACPSDFCDSRA